MGNSEANSVHNGYNNNYNFNNNVGMVCQDGGNSSISFKNKSFRHHKDKWVIITIYHYHYYQNIEDSDLGSRINTRSFNEGGNINAPTLLIEEVEGNIFNSNKLIMNATGLTNGERKMNDGIAFFGIKLKTVISALIYRNLK